jgi:hypothetical protein
MLSEFGAFLKMLMVTNGDMTQDARQARYPIL